MSFLYARGVIFMFQKKCSRAHFPSFCYCKKAKREAEEHAITCWRLERCLKVSWLWLVSAQCVGSCIFSEKLEECLRVTPLERCQDLPRFPLWSLLDASGMGIHPDSIYCEVRPGMRRRYLFECICMWPKFWIFSKAVFPSWSVSGNYVGPAVIHWKTFSEVQVWAVAAYKCLKYLVWDISHTEEWPCPAVVQ